MKALDESTGDSLAQVDTSILVVTYKNVDLTRACLQSLRESLRGLTCEVLILDNHSGDGTAEMILAEFPDMVCVPSDRNLGFAAANNELARRARGDFLLLINPDTVVQQRTVESLLEFARLHPEGGLYGGRTLKPSGELDPSSCWGAPSLWSLFCFATGLSTFLASFPLFNPEAMPGWDRDTVRRVDIVTGCLALIRKDLWNTVGGFDETFWLYGEDADLSLRVRKMGYSPMITPDATITHVVGASSQPGAKRILLLGARLALIRKHWPKRQVRLARLLLACGVALRAASGDQKGWREAWVRRGEWLD